jgi:hypothetical protein
MLPRVLRVALGASLTLAACSDPVAPRTASPDAVHGPSLAAGSGVASPNTSEVTFTIPAGQCGLTTTVTGTGVFLSVGRVSQTGAGEVRIAFHESAHGTATGADGSQYRFNYSANYEVTEVLDPSGLPVVIDLIDHFNLLGQGGARDVKVVLHGEFLFDGKLPLTPVGNPTIRGDVACDPI